jgi:FkbM family methyltransferase
MHGKQTIRRGILRLAKSGFLRNLVARMAADYGVAVLRQDRVPTCTANLLALACEGVLREQRHPRFVQVGANDGVTSDPLHKLIVRYQMTGVRVEPLPKVFQLLLTNCQSIPGLAFENVAIADSDGETVLFMPQSEDGKTVDTLASLDVCHPAFDNAGRSQLTSVRVRTMTMATLFQKHDIASLDILVVDVEGRDLQVLKAAFATGVRPRIIHFENHHLSPDQKNESRAILTAQGYRYIENFADTLAIRGEDI